MFHKTIRYRAGDVQQIRRLPRWCRARRSAGGADIAGAAKSIRFGADYGVMVVRKARKDRPGPAYGMPMQIAARARRHADPGELRLTDEFRNRLAAMGFEFRPLRQIGEVNIAKDGEAPRNRVLWSVQLDQAAASPVQRNEDGPSVAVLSDARPAKPRSG